MDEVPCVWVVRSEDVDVGDEDGVEGAGVGVPRDAGALKELK